MVLLSFKIFSDEKHSLPVFGTYDFTTKDSKNVKVKVTRGDYGPLLQLVVENLAQAKVGILVGAWNSDMVAFYFMVYTFKLVLPIVVACDDMQLEPGGILCVYNTFICRFLWFCVRLFWCAYVFRVYEAVLVVILSIFI